MCTRRSDTVACLIRVPAGPSQGVIVQAIEKETDRYDDVPDAPNAENSHGPAPRTGAGFLRSRCRPEASCCYGVVVPVDLVAMNLFLARRSSVAPAQGVVARLNPALLMLPPSKNM